MKRYLSVLICLGLLLPIAGAFAEQTVSDQSKPVITKGSLLPGPNPRTSPSSQITDNNIDEVQIVYQTFFEDGLGSWTVNGSWGIGAPTSGPGSGYYSPNCAATNLTGNYGSNEDARLISPWIELPELVDLNGQVSLFFQEWYQLESEYDYGFVQVSVDGDTWNTIDIRTGENGWEYQGLSLTAYAGQTVKLGFLLQSDEDFEFPGWYLDDVTVVMYDPSDLDITMNSFNSVTFPIINMAVEVTHMGDPLPILDDEDFAVYENGVLQTDLFEVVPPQGGGEQLADFIFILDVTGSMREEIESVRANMSAFMDSLTASDIQFAVGFIVFGDIFYTYNEGDLYTNPLEIQYIINNIELGEHGIGTGADWPENQLGSMAEGVFMNFRPGAQRIEIMLTDAPSHENDEVTPWVVGELIGVLQFNNITVYPIFDTGDVNQLDQYVPIADETNGDYYYIYDTFNEILNDIVGGIGGQYTVRYSSSSPVPDGRMRYVTVEVEYLDEMTQVYSTYVPNQAPSVVRTAATLALHDQAWPEDTTFPIRARVTDASEPYVQSVRLYYRTTSNMEYMEAHMGLVYGDATEGIYRADIPGSYANAPGIDYFFRASDGFSVGSDPSVNPTDFPYQIAILPNEAPQVLHQPIQTYATGGSILVQALITDETSFISDADLYYREYGNQLYQSVALTDIGEDVYAAYIPADAANESGLEYYLRAEDNYGVASLHGTPDDPHFIEAQIVPRPDVFGIVVDGSIVGAEEFTDLNNIALFDINGTDGLDMNLDHPETEPDTENYFAVWFGHQPLWNWVYWRVDCHSSEMISPTYTVFGFKVGSDQLGEIVNLDFGVGTEYPDEWGAFLRDMETNNVIDLHDVRQYQFILDAEERQFRIYCGTAAEAMSQLAASNESDMQVNNLPQEFAIASIQPNPFNPSTTITLALPEAANVKAVIYNINGREVTTLINSRMVEGTHALNWTPSNLASGLYFVRASVNGKLLPAKKMVYLR
jgi:von Willebrand factor type A domain/Immune inhibitor A-like, MAM domain/Secretion system C-terminal sorting domain